jgi:hypothetical protein
MLYHSASQKIWGCLACIDKKQIIYYRPITTLNPIQKEELYVFPAEDSCTIRLFFWSH